MKRGGIDFEVVQPYAQALMSVARSKDMTEQVGEDVRSLLKLLQGSEDLRNFLANPFAKIEDKKNVLGQIMGDSSPYLRNFVMLLVDRIFVSDQPKVIDLCRSASSRGVLVARIMWEL